MTAHEGTRAEFLARVRSAGEAAAREDGDARQRYLADAFGFVCDPRALYAAADHVAREGGPARGADGIGPGDLDRAALAALVPVLALALRDRTYHPGRVRPVAVPKPDGGTRTLSIPTFADRVVERAIVTALSPYLDPQLSPTTFGGRPGRSTAHAIATVATLVGRHALPVVVTADVRKAFDCVPHDRLAAVLRARLGDTPLTDLLLRVVRGRGTGGVGLAQGGAASMLLLNLYLDALIDIPWRDRHPDRPLARWVDDLLVPCADEAEGATLLAELTEMVATAGLSLKPTAAVTDLREGGTEWLGLHLGSGPTGKLTVGIAEPSWNQLKDHLEEAHRDDNPETRARQTILGWITAQGAAYRHEDHELVVARMHRTTDTHDFPGIITHGELMEEWERAHSRYQAVLTVTDVSPHLSRSKTDEDNYGEPAGASPARTPASIVPMIGNTPASSTQSYRIRLMCNPLQR